MKTRSIVFLIFVVSCCELISQDLTQTGLDSFYIQTINDYFGYRDSVNGKLKDYYILGDSVPISVIGYYSNSNLHFINYSKAYPLIKSDSISFLYWIRKKNMGLDTIDISIGGWTVEFERVFRLQKIEGKLRLVTRNYNFSAWCGGTLGYIPQGRIIYNHVSSDWQYLSEQTIIAEKTRILRNNINNVR